MCITLFHSLSNCAVQDSQMMLHNSGSEVKSLSHIQLFVTPWSVAQQAPLSMGFFRQEYWSGLPFPSPGDLPNPGIKPRSLTLQADSLPSEHSCLEHSKWLSY